MKNTNQTKFTPNHGLREELEKYLKNWYWFLLCLVLAISGGYFYLKYSTPIYMASASIIINSEDGNSSANEMTAFADMGVINGMGTSSMDKEMAILRSRRLMREVVTALNLNIQFFQEGSVRDEERYQDIPFSLKILRMDDKKIKKSGGGDFAIAYSGKDKFQIENLGTGESYEVTAGTPVDLKFADVVIKPIPGARSFSNIKIKFSEVEKVASKYRGKLILIPVEKKSNVVEIVMHDPVKEKARDVVDQLILEFNRDAIEDKNLIAGNSAKFINERLDIINDELETVETGKEEFKESNRLTDIQAESQMFMQNASEYNKQRQEIGTQIELAKAMLDYLSSSSNTELLPANLGIEENGINQQIGEYNNLVLERNRILGGSSEKNPVIIRMNSRMDQIKTNILLSLQRLLSNLKIAQDDISRQSSSIGSRILAVPSQERQYRGIERQQGIKETLYLFLLQKREENSLAMAITAPKAKIVDRAFSSGGVVSPKSRNIYLGTAILGLFLPFSFIYFKGMLDNKVRKRADIENLTNEVAFLGELPKVKKRKEMLIGENDRSILAEAFRILITNLQYLLVNIKDKTLASTILVTSTVKGEGKSFTSVNLGVSLANTGKNVLLIGGDLRNPQLQKFMAGKNSLGVSDYLVNNDICPRSLIEKSTLHRLLDILPSGNIPPNPSELLRQKELGKMIEELKPHYDFIIIDSAPSMLVTDTFLISEYADLTLYVVRAGYTEKDLLGFALDSQKAGSFRNLSFLLTDVDFSNLGYGNKYGYGYAEEKRSFWKGRKTSFA